MQSLEVISVNIWHILISLCNLLILFLIVKRFLFKPVKKALEKPIFRWLCMEYKKCMRTYKKIILWGDRNA